MKRIRQDELWYDFFYTELTTGLRRGEICGLKWTDFEPDTGKLKIKRSIYKKKGGGLTVGETKTETGTRTVLLPPSTAELLRKRKETAVVEWIAVGLPYMVLLLFQQLSQLRVWLWPPQAADKVIIAASGYPKEGTHGRYGVVLPVQMDDIVFDVWPHFLSVNRRKSRSSWFSIFNRLISYYVKFYNLVKKNGILFEKNRKPVIPCVSMLSQ